MSLDVNSEKFNFWVGKTEELLSEYFSEVDEKKVFAGKSPGEVQKLLNEPLPTESENMGDLLTEVRNKIFTTITNSAGPRYFGYITGGGNQVAVLAEMIKASLNQNNLKWHSSPASTELERLVMRWIAEFIGYPKDSAGALLSGGSVANLNCLAVARKIKGPANLSDEGIYHAKPMTFYVSQEGHSSFDKAMDVLGLGKKYLRKIPTDDQLRIDTDELEKQIVADIDSGLNPVCTIAVAGTTNSGAVDDLNEVARICREYDLWYHVDAAYGGPAAKVEGVSKMFLGIGKADSVVVNPHKWLYVPFEAGGMLVKNEEHLRKTFSTIPDYLRSDQRDDGRTDLMEYNLPLTKEFKALKVWMTLKAYGADRLREEIASDIQKAQYLTELVDEEEDLELMAPAPLSIVCFRYNPGELNEDALNKLNDELIHQIESDGRIFLTGTKVNGETALRVCFINHRTAKEDIDLIRDVVLEIGERLSG